MPSIVGRAGVKRSNRNTDNELKKLKAKLLTLPDIAVKAVISEVFPVVVRETVQDSGKAAYNWWVGVGKAQRRFYIDEHNLGPIGLPGEKRSLGGIYNPSGLSSESPEVIVGLKIAYIKKFIADNNLTLGATIYNQTPKSNRDTFKGTYEGNAKIRVAMSLGLVEAQGAIDNALRVVG